VAKHERKSGGRKKRVEAKNTRVEARKSPAAGSYGSLVAAVASVALLGGLLYASCRGTDTRISAESEGKAAAPVEQPRTPAGNAPAQVAPQANAAANAAANAGAGQGAKSENWNDAQIAWQPYEAGLAKAKAENKPVCLVFFTNWCPHSRNYSQVFQDPRVVAKARDFVMIRVNPDDEPAIGDKHAPDGTYVPRTFFLSPNGERLADVHAPRPQFVHFYDEHDPASLLGGMDAAQRKVARPM